MTNTINLKTVFNSLEVKNLIAIRRAASKADCDGDYGKLASLNSEICEYVGDISKKFGVDFSDFNFWHLTPKQTEDELFGGFGPKK